MLRVTFFAIPNQMEIKRTEVHYFVRKPRWENNEFTRSIAASSGHSKAEIDSRRCTLVHIAGHIHLEMFARSNPVLDRHSEVHRPLHHDAGAGCSGYGERNAERDEAQDRLNRQLQRLSADENRLAAWQIGEMSPLQRQERTVQNEKSGRCKSRENPPLKSQGFPEHLPVAERFEPEHVNVIRQRGPAAEEDDAKGGENEKEAAAMSWRTRPRPINRLRHCPTRFLPALPLSRVSREAIVQGLKKSSLKKSNYFAIRQYSVYCEWQHAERSYPGRELRSTQTRTPSSLGEREPRSEERRVGKEC